jgi:hypothetical protein
LLRIVEKENMEKASAEEIRNILAVLNYHRDFKAYANLYKALTYIAAIAN